MRLDWGSKRVERWDSLSCDCVEVLLEINWKRFEKWLKKWKEEEEEEEESGRLWESKKSEPGSLNSSQVVRRDLPATLHLMRLGCLRDSFQSILKFAKESGGDGGGEEGMERWRRRKTLRRRTQIPISSILGSKRLISTIVRFAMNVFFVIPVKYIWRPNQTKELEEKKERFSLSVACWKHVALNWIEVPSLNFWSSCPNQSSKSSLKDGVKYLRDLLLSKIIIQKRNTSCLKSLPTLWLSPFPASSFQF